MNAYMPQYDRYNTFQDVGFELPMSPITVMRNGLGMDQGGSGKPIVREE